MYDSWVSRIRLFMKWKKHGRMMLDSIENGLLVYPTVEENRQTRPKKYSELAEAQQLQDDCDVQATNIILYDLPLTLYNLFDKFAYVQGETLKFVTDVKLAKSLYTTNYDQLYAYLSQHKRDANEVRITRERYSDPLAFVANSPTLYNPSQSPQHSGEDPIECIKKAMAFLFALASRFPPLNNQLRTSSNPINQATIQDDRVTVQQVQGRQNHSYAGIENRGITTTSKGNVAVGPPRVVKCNNSEAQEAGQMLDEEQLAFLVDPGISEALVAQQTIPQNSDFQTDDLDAYDSDCDDLSSAKAVLMANISSCDHEVLSEDTNPSAPNDLLELSLVEQMTDHVAHLDKENQINKMVNESLTAELERYKERNAIFKQRLNVDLNQRGKLIDSQMDDLIRDRNAKLTACQQ
ncbi:hypothetical protein Tco_1508189 [Tanacetum coccineum]